MTERRHFAVPGAAPADARRFVGAVLHDAAVDERVASDAVLAASELATNAIVHAGTDFDVVVEVEPEVVRLAVRDRSTQPPDPRRPSCDTPGGRGLVILEELTDRWGVRQDGQGKAVWAELRRPGHPLHR